MMVAIVITIMVVGMAFSVLGLVQKQMTGIAFNLNKATQVDLLEQSLWLDFNRYELIRSLNDELVFKNEVDSVKYEIQKDLIIKDIDTFSIKIDEFEKFLDGKKVNLGAIDAIKIIASKESQSKTLFIYKNNDATLYMK
jgi:hypothetical protein